MIWPAPLDCSPWKLARVEVGGRLFTVQDHGEGAPAKVPAPPPETDDRVIVLPQTDWVKEYRLGRDPHVSR